MTLWAPVVYGRTATSDTWWRAVPKGLDQHGWLGIVTYSALAAGRELKQRPRFLLAQNAAHRIVGVACQARDLSDTMRSAGSRELFCFVGWATSLTEQLAQDDTPALQELERGYRDWAALVYTQVMSEIWDAPATASMPPVTTVPEEAVWAPPVRRVRPGVAPSAGPWAEKAWPEVWAAAAAASEPLTCVIGWQHISSARFEDATHIGVADAPFRPPPTVGYEDPSAPPGLARSPEPTPPQSVAPSVPVAPAVPRASTVPDGPSAGAPETPVAGQDIGLGPGRAIWHGEKPVGRRPPRDHGPGWAKLAVAAAVGAAVAGVAVALASPGAASSASHAPSPSPSPSPPALAAGTGATGPPVLLQVVIPASSKPIADSLVQYYAHVLSLGQSTARIALWPNARAASPGACASAVATAPVVVPVKAHPDLWLCVELKGSPSRYGLIDVTAVTKTAVTATATLWP